MANCNRCSEPIFFAWHESWLRWLPCELVSIRDEDVEHGGGLLYADHHKRHQCSLKARFRRDQEADESFFNAHTSPAPKVLTMVTWKSAHGTLFITPDAPIEVVQAAYRALAKLYHPDQGGDPERMVELNRAYASLVKDRDAR